MIPRSASGGLAACKPAACAACLLALIAVRPRPLSLPQPPGEGLRASNSSGEKAWMAEAGVCHLSEQRLDGPTMLGAWPSPPAQHYCTVHPKFYLLFDSLSCFHWICHTSHRCFCQR